MKRNWEYKNIEECLEKVTVVSKLQTKDFLSKGKFPIVSQEVDYISGYWNNDSDVVRLLHPVVVFGDHSRVVKYIDFDFVVGADGVKILSPKDFLNPKFLYYFVKSADIPSLGYSRHYKLLREKDVPVPPLEEQSRIVAELDLLTGIIDKQNAQLKELDNLAQSIFYDMFGDPIENPKGWDVKKLESLCKVITKGTTPTTLGYPFVSNGIGFVKVEAFSNGFIDASKLSYVSEECNQALARSQLQENDLLVCIAGATIGKMALVTKNVLPANTNQACAIVRLISIENLSYIYAFLKQRFAYDVQNMGKGVAQPNLSLGQIRNLDIPLPPHPLQQSFAEKIQSIEKQKEAIRASIADTQKLLDYTMDKYFG